MNLDIITTGLTLINWAALATYVVGQVRGAPDSILTATCAPWIACTSLALAAADWSQHDHVAAAGDMVAAAIWASLWWTNRPPRPPRRRRVLSPARSTS